MTQSIVQEKIESEIIQMISDIFQKPTESLKKNMSLVGKIGFESVEILELSFMLEQTFDMKVAEDELWNLPNYLIEKSLFEDGKFADRAFDIVHKSLPRIKKQDLDNMDDPQQLLQYLTISDVAHYVYNSLPRFKDEH